jgi:ABC-type branched-subunit amino acid transport system ATPase component
VVTPVSVFGMLVSAQALVVTMFGGIGTVWGPVIGSAILIPVAETLHAELGSVLPGIQGVIYGAAITAVVLIAPEGIFWNVRDALRRRFGKPAPTPASGEAAPNVVRLTPAERSDAQRAAAASAEIILEARGLSKNFGGLKAVEDVSFQVRKGMILGIIGPNGAGKTTAFNLLNGFLWPSSGQVLLDGKDITRRKPHEVCRLGVGRTFQIMRPFRRMSVADNVKVGAYVRAGSEAEAERLAAGAIARVGLSAIADRPASGLTTKELRLMELARALAGQPEMLLLDETLAGLGRQEVEEVLDTIRGIADEGVTIVIIEHTMHAMVKLVDEFVVLDHGAVLVEGRPDAVTRDPKVIGAYLGKKWSAHAQR